MLESLTIRRIALIDDVTIQFHNGMQVLTGETGAGKSIVVDSVNLILGGRAEKDMIRTGADKASVEAVFNVTGNNQVQEFLKKEEIDYDGHTVTVYREISNNGKNTCRVCGVLFPVSRLKELAVLMMDLHGQSEHQFLNDPDKQLYFLDQTGDDNHREMMQKTREACELFLANHRAYARMVRQNQNREARLSSLERDLSELRSASIQPGESDELLAKRKQLAEDEKRYNALYGIRENISGEMEGISCLQRLREASERMKSIAVSDEKMRDISVRCESIYFELEEIAYQISMMTEKAEIDPGALEKTDKRLEMIHRLERKYRTDSDGIPEILNEMEREYKELTDLEDQIRLMSSEHKKLLSSYRNTAGKLTGSRHQLAEQFEKRMMKELKDLGMEHTQFKVQFKENETGRPLMPSPTGDDCVEFMISPNPGEPLKPMSKIASGGELSRLMLAVKTLESAHNGVEAMVFDEIDTGISGRMAQIVAEKMISISRERQVICVTHLPQIAAAADYHYLVKKTITGGRTVTSVSALDRKERTEEIGRMISGADGITDESNKYASGMLSAAEKLKKNPSITSSDKA